MLPFTLFKVSVAFKEAVCANIVDATVIEINKNCLNNFKMTPTFISKIRLFKIIKLAIILPKITNTNIKVKLAKRIYNYFKFRTDYPLIVLSLN